MRLATEEAATIPTGTGCSMLKLNVSFLNYIFLGYSILYRCTSNESKDAFFLIKIDLL